MQYVEELLLLSRIVTVLYNVFWEKTKSGPSTRLVETRTRQLGPSWRVMETGHPSTRAVNSRSGNRALLESVQIDGFAWSLLYIAALMVVVVL